MPRHRPAAPRAPSDAGPAGATAVPANGSPYFGAGDWIAAGMTLVMAGAVYVYYVSPEVTMEDSGELVTGAFNFGVPHPPGYPLWAFLGWVWSHLVVRVGNPAWRIGLLSALTGALLVATMTLLMTRSILILLRAVGWTRGLDEKMKRWIALTIGSAAALLFAFNRGVWLWACVPEMRVLNVFLFFLTTGTYFAWMMRPEQRGFLYATLLLLGLGTTNHQTIVVMAAPFLFGALVVGLLADGSTAGARMRNLKDFWELLVAALVSATAGFLIWAWLQTDSPEDFLSNSWWWRAVLTGVASALVLVIFGTNGWLNRRRALVCAGLFLLGCSFYLYMPLAASTNPPMNWGYTAIKQGFLHHIAREQYQQLKYASLFSENFLLQIVLFGRGLVSQYSGLLAVFALVTAGLLPVAWKSIQPRGRAWLLFVWVAFLTASLGLLIIINPGLDKQQQEINIKFFAPAHGFFAVLIGYGLALAIGAAAQWRRVPRPLWRAVCVALLLVPVIPYQRNWALCEQRHHDFGYQFGYRMFYPGGGYPPMEENAVLFGGTDPGRFVPTYMIFCESRVPGRCRFRDPHLDPAGGAQFDRRDVYIITQNALADGTYMSYIRDHYDYSRPKNNSRFQRWLGRDTTYPVDPIWIPAERDSQVAFQQFVQEYQSHAPGPGGNVQIKEGRVQVSGQEEVMQINGILARMIFEQNKHKHAFYVEESYVIPWMYPYLEPTGTVLKLDKEPLPSPEQDPELWRKIVDRDRTYWDKLCDEFLARPEFRRDADAQKTFSKLRSAIGGIYAYRHLAGPAEYAFRQAMRLYQDSPEANFRLALLYVELGRFDDAVATLEAMGQRDPLNAEIGNGIRKIQFQKQVRLEIGQLEAAYATNARDFGLLMQLAQAYAKYGQPERLAPFLDRFVAQTNVSADEMLQVAQSYLNLKQFDRTIATLQLMVQRHPQDGRGYYALALMRLTQNQTDDALALLARAFQLNPQLLAEARTDQRLNPLRANPRFQQLITPTL